MADNKQIDPRRPIPASGYDRLRDNISANVTVLGQTPPETRPNLNRGDITTRKDDTVQDVSIGIQDHDEAIKWLRLSANQDNKLAQYHLGNIYLKGEGILRNNVTAHMWYNISSANGSEGAGRSRDELADLMTADAIEKATAMARECMKSNYKKCGY